MSAEVTGERAGAAGPTGRHAGAVRVWGVNWLWWPMFSGAAVQGQRLYAALTGRGLEFTVLTARHGQAAARPRQETLDGVRVLRLRIPPACASRFPRLGATWSRLRQVWFSLACAARILAARHRIDLLHVHAAFLPPLVLLARWLGIPIVVKQTMAEPPGSGIGGRLLRWSLFRADRLVTMSRSQGDSLPGLPPERIEMIPQGVDTTLFQPVSDQRKLELRGALALDPAGKWIVFVGAIRPRKGVDLLMHAFVEAARRESRLGLILIGQYDFSGHPVQHMAESLRRYRASLEQTLQGEPAAERVHWIGKLPPPEVARYLQAADLFCLPSRLEGTPSAPLEAMACGLPVVVSALGGTSAELLTDGREGFVVSGEDPARYAACFETLASDPETARRMGRLGRRRIEDGFSLERAVLRYRDLFVELARGRRPRDSRSPSQRQ